MIILKKIKIGNCFEASEISLGCMRISQLSEKEAKELIETAIELGIDFFDHADIYGQGSCEELFGNVFDKSLRDKIKIQSKCGIRSKMFDFSKEHILNAVDSSLKRLKTDYLDVLLLHRPDALVEPEEVAEAFSILLEKGKVLNFGVSNQNPHQIELLKKYVKQPLLINQLQLSIINTGMIDAGLNVNMENQASINRDGGILDYCRLNDITIQPWSPFLYGFFEGVFLDNDKFPELNKKIDEIASKYNVKNTAIAIAWLLRHPAKMQPIVGTTNKQRLADIAQASTVNLTRKEWYEIYLSSGKILP